MDKRILLASPRGFCFGVKRAIKMLDDTIEHETGTVYVRKEIVHNEVIVKYYKSLGVIFVDEVCEVPEDSVVVFSAHGVAPPVREMAGKRGLRVVDTTCPLVTKVHKEARQLAEEGYSIILIGEKDHKEVIGITGEAPENIHVIQNETDIDNITGINSPRIAWLSQTTLNIDDTRRVVEYLRKKYPTIEDPPKEDICYATKNRQYAVKCIAAECDLFIVVGSANSSNTVRLAVTALDAGAGRVVRVDKPEELSGIDFSDINTIGITSGASTEKKQLKRIIVFLGIKGYNHIEERAAAEENGV